MIGGPGFGETVTISRQVAAGEDSQGNPTFTTVSITVEGCAFAPGPMSENVGVEGVRAITAGTIYAPVGTVFYPSDLVTIRGDVFTVEGESGMWKSPFTGVPWGVEQAVKRAV